MNAESKVTPISQAVAEIDETRRIVAVPASSPLLPQSLDQAVKLAELMCKGKLVPQHLQNSPADCLMVIEQASRWRMSPFAVAQSTSSIHGKLMFEGKLVAAAVHNSGILSGRLSYDFSGSGETRAVKVSGTMKGEQQPRTIDTSIKESRTANEHWKKQPDQQLVYAGTRIWARRHAPEVMLGVYVPEEMVDVEIIGSTSHSGTQTAVQAVAKSQPQDTEARRAIVASLEAAAAMGTEAYATAWTSATKEDRQLVGTDEHNRLKAIAAAAEKPQETAHAG